MICHLEILLKNNFKNYRINIIIDEGYSQYKKQITRGSRRQRFRTRHLYYYWLCVSVSALLFNVICKRKFVLIINLINKFGIVVLGDALAEMLLGNWSIEYANEKYSI